MSLSEVTINWLGGGLLLYLILRLGLSWRIKGVKGKRTKRKGSIFEETLGKP